MSDKLGYIIARTSNANKEVDYIVSIAQERDFVSNIRIAPDRPRAYIYHEKRIAEFAVNALNKGSRIETHRFSMLTVKIDSDRTLI